MSQEKLRVCLITDVEMVHRAVAVSCLPPHHLQHFPLSPLLDAQQALTEAGRKAVRACARADVVLLYWQLSQAPVLNTLGYRVRKKASVPVIALCGGGRRR